MSKIYCFKYIYIYVCLQKMYNITYLLCILHHNFYVLFIFQNLKLYRFISYFKSNIVKSGCQSGLRNLYANVFIYIFPLSNELFSNFMINTVIRSWECLAFIWNLHVWISSSLQALTASVMRLLGFNGSAKKLPQTCRFLLRRHSASRLYPSPPPKTHTA